MIGIAVMVFKRFDRVCIVAHGYMMYDGKRRSLGGIQSYVDALVRLLSPICNEIIIIQPSDIGFEIEEPPNIRVVGVLGYGRPVGRYYQKYLANSCDVTICTHLPWAKWCSGSRLIGIQHGIGWDGYGSSWQGILGWFRERYYVYWELAQTRRMVRKTLPMLDKLICVDLNFPNWLRATYPTQPWEEILTYVPNFGDPISEETLREKISREKEQITVLIARRFEKMRGLPLMAKIVSDIYDHWPKVRFVFAGWGSQKKQMQDILKGKNRCEILRLSPEEVQAANLHADIVVIPTIWSEGTSLSCIEGMCAGAAVLATSIGGLGNLILPGYNGLLVSPTYSGLRVGLESLLGDADLRTDLANRGYMSAKTSFSREVWNKRVMRVVLGHD